MTHDAMNMGINNGFPLAEPPRRRTGTPPASRDGRDNPTTLE